MEIEEQVVEVLDEGVENCDLVCACCAAGVTSSRS